MENEEKNKTVPHSSDSDEQETLGVSEKRMVMKGS